MNRLTDLGINAWEILANAANVTVAEMRDLVSKGAIAGENVDWAIGTLVKTMEAQYGGAMKKQAETIEAQMNVLRSSVQEAWVDIVATLGEELTPTLIHFNEELGRLRETGDLDRFINRLAESFFNLVEPIADGAESLSEFVINLIESPEALDALLDKLDATINKIKESYELIKNVVKVGGSLVLITKVLDLLLKIKAVLSSIAGMSGVIPTAALGPAAAAVLGPVAAAGAGLLTFKKYMDETVEVYDKTSKELQTTTIGS